MECADISFPFLAAESFFLSLAAKIGEAEASEYGQIRSSPAEKP
jgi:hypothetical protein